MPTRTQTRAGRRATPLRRPVTVSRRKPQKTGMAKVADRITGILPGMGSKKPKRRAGGGRGRKGPAGVALLGAAGLAMKNRGRLMSMMRRKDGSKTRA